MMRVTISIVLIILFCGCSHVNNSSNEGLSNDFINELTVIATSTIVYNIENKEWPHSSEEIENLFRDKNYPAIEKGNSTLEAPKVVLSDVIDLVFIPVTDNKILIQYKSKHGYDVIADLLCTQKPENLNSGNIDMELKMKATPIKRAKYSTGRNQYNEVVSEILVKSILVLLEEYLRR
jgi:hypothetical protein